jgi:preprotein translocase subunit Sec63
MTEARWPAVIAVCLGLVLYVRSPIDLIPDRLGAVGLLDDLVVFIIAIVWVSRRLARAPAARPTTIGANAGATWDPHAVLGVSRDASAEEITKAYREQMLRYHPDHVAHLGDEIQELAHRKTLDIQRAYGEIRRP